MELLSSKKLWLSANDLAKELGVGKTLIYEMAARGAFGVPLQLSARRGGALRFHRDKVIGYIQARLAATAEDLGIFDPEK